MADLELHLSDRDVERIAAQVAALLKGQRAPAPTAPADATWLTTPQAAQRLGLSVQRLEIWRSAGGGPPYHKPSRGIVRYKPAELDKFMADSARKHTGEDDDATRAPTRAAPPGRPRGKGRAK